MRNFLAPLLIFFTLSSNAQSSFFKTYNVDSTSCSGSFVIQTQDKGFVVCGSSNANAYIIKLDSNGVHQWDKRYNITPQTYPFGLAETKNGDLVIALNNANTTVAGGRTFLMEIDRIGNIIWSRIYDHNGGGYLDFGMAMRGTSDNGFVLLIATLVGADNNGISILKTDSSGNIVWSKGYGGEDYNIYYGADIKETSDHGYIVTGYESAGNASNILMLKTDSIGQPQWVKYYGDIYYNYYGIGVLPLSDGYIVGAAYQEGDYFAMKLNLEGDTVWTRLTNEGIEYLSSIVPAGNNEFLLAGNLNFALATETELVKLNDAGDTIWTRVFVDSVRNEIYAMSQTNDNGVILTGFRSSSVLVMKTDSNAHISCHQISSLPLQFIKSKIDTILINNDTVVPYAYDFITYSYTATDTLGGNENIICSTLGVRNVSVKNELLIYPNPANNTFIVQTTGTEKQLLQVFNITGQLMFTQNIFNSKTTIDASNLANGIYSVRLIRDDGVENEKLIIVR